MRRQLFGICFTTALCTGASLAGAQPVEARRFGVSGTVGVFRFLDSSMTDVYGRRLVPVTAQFDVQVASDVLLFGGFQWTKANGQTVVLGTPVANERYATSIRIASYRFGAQVFARVAPRWTLGAGAGVCVAGYLETWPDAGLEVSDTSTGFLALAEGRYRMNARWAVVLRAEYTTLPATTTGTATKVNLGGVHGSAGLRVNF